MAQLAVAYDWAVPSTDPDDVSVGGTTTRVHGLVNCGAEFDSLYVYRPVLEACCRVIGRPFKLSTMLARPLRPHAPAQALHADFARDVEGWLMVGCVLMVDEFRSDDEATRFVPGSHEWSTVPDDLTNPPSVLRRSDPGLRAGGLRHHLQRIGLARPFSESALRAPALDTGRVHPA